MEEFKEIDFRNRIIGLIASFLDRSYDQIEYKKKIIKHYGLSPRERGELFNRIESEMDCQHLDGIWATNDNKISEIIDFYSSMALRNQLYRKEDEKP